MRKKCRISITNYKSKNRNSRILNNQQKDESSHEQNNKTFEEIDECGCKMFKHIRLKKAERDITKLVQHG